ncbi:MAG: hypothetical protein B7Y39_07625 [Bdellovibrio sp. 28-41-41]|nr:MAG: hypothetical protein B7Y39_07625 [Bdellovibrio sp. 28-41-41]
MKYHTPESLADLLCCSKSTIYRLVKNKKILAVKFGNLIRIPESSLSIQVTATTDAITHQKKEKLWE